MKLLAVFTFVICISVGLALKCYRCTSTTSMSDCVKNQKEMNCTQPLNRCSTMSLEFSGSKQFSKACNLKSFCDAEETALKACKAAGGTCKLDCCDKDLCNGGTAPVVSVLLMVACALTAFVR